MNKLMERLAREFDERAKSVMMGPQTRAAEFRVESVDLEARTVEVSFSSERPVRRWWGWEILRHDKASIDMERANLGLPVLDEHGRQIGIGEPVWLKGKKLWSKVRFGSSQIAEETLQDVAAGIRKFTSAGYRNEILHEIKARKMGREPDLEAGDLVMGWMGPQSPSEDRPVRWFESRWWTPAEFSFVSVAADIDVGARADDEDLRPVVVEWLDSRADEAGATAVEPAPKTEDGEMVRRGRNTTVRLMEGEGGAGSGGAAPTPTPAPEAVRVIDEKAAEERGEEAAAKRTAEVIGVLEHHKRHEMIKTAIEQRWDVARANKEILAHMATPEAAAQVVEGERHDPRIGLTPKEVRECSLSEAILAHLDGRFDGSKYHRMSEAVSKQTGREPQRGGFLWPADILEQPMRGYDQMMQRADLTGTQTTHGTGTGAGAIGETHRPDMFIDLLRNSTQVVPMGATVLDGLVGNVTIPKLTAAATNNWINPETYSGTAESSMTIGSVTGTIKTVRARQDIRRHLLMQGTPAVDAMVSRELALRLGIAVDLAAIAGTGASEQPLGILNTGSIGDVSHGATGGAPVWASAVELWKDVASSNAAFGRLGHLTSALVAGKLMTVGRKDAGDTSSFGFVWDNDVVGGHPARWSNNVPDTLTKGGAIDLSAWIFGNWADLIIFLWGVLEIKPDPAPLADSDGLVLRAFQSADVAVRHPESFSAAQDVDAS